LTAVRLPALPHPRAAAAVLAILSLGACTGERPSLADDTATTTTASTSTTVAAPATAEVAEAKGASIDVFATEDAEVPDHQVEAGVDTTVDTIPVVFLVKSKGPERLEVYLPLGPADEPAWVDADDVTITSVAYRIEVDLSDHRLRVFDGDEVIVDEPVVVGIQDHPPPGDEYYVKELVEPPDPDGTYGSFAYGLSGFANPLEGFTDEDGVVGIHGTDDPEALGEDTARGSIGVDNAVIERLVNDIGLPLGTPVEISE
jgi:lipoprotein-anchoring transpeptidase ErfK/SrfK